MYWQSKHFNAFVREDCTLSFPLLIRALLRDKEKHWSTTVNKMTCTVLCEMREMSTPLFEDTVVEICDTKGEGRGEVLEWLQSFLKELDPGTLLASLPYISSLSHILLLIYFSLLLLSRILASHLIYSHLQ